MHLTGGTASSGAGGSIILKPGTGSSAGSTFIQDSGGTTQMTIDGNGVTVASTLTAQSTVYALGGIYVGSHGSKALIANIIRGSYTVAASTAAVTPGNAVDISFTASGALDPSGSTYQQVMVSPNQNYESARKPMFMAWVSATNTINLRIFNTDVSNNLSPGGTGGGVVFYYVIIQYT